MLLGYLIFAVVNIVMIADLIKAIRTKKYMDILCVLFILPFNVFFISTMILGGSAFNDAVNDYSLYQPGHYYLVSHGNYTEVSYGQYMYAKIIEVIGIASFGIAFILGFIRTFHVNDD